MKACSQEKFDDIDPFEKSSNHLKEKCGIDLSVDELKEISEEIKNNKNFSLDDVKVRVKNNSVVIETDESQSVNESDEFKRQMEELKLSSKNLCAFVSFYPNGGGKIYTYLVDAYYHGGHWYLEDRNQEVFVMEFGELADDELPVPKDKMKHLRWENDEYGNDSEDNDNVEEQEDKRKWALS